MQVLCKTTLLYSLIVSIYGLNPQEPPPPTLEMLPENRQDIEEFFKNNPDIYGKLQHIERLAGEKDHNATEVRILQDELVKLMQPRIVDTCDDVFFKKHNELYNRVFVFKNATKFRNLSSILNPQNQELMESASLLTLYRDELSKFVRQCIRKGVNMLKNGERVELTKRFNESLVNTTSDMKTACKNHAEFEMALDVKQTFCHNIVDRWLEEHVVDMERAFIIEQKTGFIPIPEELRKKLIYQCFLFVDLQKDYLKTCVNSVGEIV